MISVGGEGIISDSVANLDFPFEECPELIDSDRCLDSCPADLADMSTMMTSFSLSTYEQRDRQSDGRIRACSKRVATEIPLGPVLWAPDLISILDNWKITYTILRSPTAPRTVVSCRTGQITVHTQFFQLSHGVPGCPTSVLYLGVPVEGLRLSCHRKQP